MKDEDGASGCPVFMGFGYSSESRLVLPGGFVKALKMLHFRLESVSYGKDLGRGPGQSCAHDLLVLPRQ